MPLARFLTFLSLSSLTDQFSQVHIWRTTAHLTTHTDQNVIKDPEQGLAQTFNSWESSNSHISLVWMAYLAIYTPVNLTISQSLYMYFEPKTWANLARHCWPVCPPFGKLQNTSFNADNAPDEERETFELPNSAPSDEDVPTKILTIQTQGARDAQKEQEDLKAFLFEIFSISINSCAFRSLIRALIYYEAW